MMMNMQKLPRFALLIASFALALMFAQIAMSQQGKVPATASKFDKCMSVANGLNGEVTLEVDGCLQAHQQSCNVKFVASIKTDTKKVRLTAISG